MSVQIPENPLRALSDRIFTHSQCVRRNVLSSTGDLFPLIVEQKSLNVWLDRMLSDFRGCWEAERNAPIVNPRRLHYLMVRYRRILHLGKWLTKIGMVLSRTAFVRAKDSIRRASSL